MHEENQQQERPPREGTSIENLTDDKNRTGNQGRKEHLPHEDRHQGEEDH
jgi:hypothetical protein